MLKRITVWLRSILLAAHRWVDISETWNPSAIRASLLECENRIIAGYWAKFDAAIGCDRGSKASRTPLAVAI
jgi:hypothetical protein